VVPNTANEPQSEPMTVFLLKTKTGQFEDGLEEAHRLERHDLKEAVPFEGAIFIAPQRMSPPPWMDFLKDGAKEELRALFNASTKAVSVRSHGTSGLRLHVRIWTNPAGLRTDPAVLRPTSRAEHR
jgi:hypothetical protein